METLLLVMTDAAFHEAIRRVRRRHWVHYPVQAAATMAMVLLASQRAASGTDLEPRLATWPALLLLSGLLVLVSVLVYLVSARIRPNLRRPAEENIRLYQIRTLLRNSLLGLLCLPPLASYAVTRDAWHLLFFGLLLVALAAGTVPSAKAYQRWLIA